MIDYLYQYGWESDADCENWWKSSFPEIIFTYDEAIEACKDWLFSE